MLAPRAPELDTCSIVPEMVTVIPEKRITAREARRHSFFTTKPLPCRPRDISLPDQHCHDYSAQRRRVEVSKARTAGLDERLARQRPRARGKRETPLSASPLATPPDERKR